MLGDVDREQGGFSLTYFFKTLRTRNSMTVHCALRARMFTDCSGSKRRLLRSRILAALSTALLL